jgi:hypothetical protein
MLCGAALENEALYDTYLSSEDTQTIGWIAVENMKHAHVHEEIPITGGHAHIMMHNQVRCFFYIAAPRTPRYRHSH